jgi:hypothetical protein
MSRLSGLKVVCIAVAGVALSLLAANVADADSLSDQAAKLDIVGVHLGMSLAQAKSAVTQHRKDMSWNEVKGDLGIQEDQYLASAYAQGGKATATGREETMQLIFSAPPGDPKVLAVSRSLSFDASQAPTVENLASSLKEKFGQPSDDAPPIPQNPRRVLVWAWNKSGQLSKPYPRNCDSVFIMGRPTFSLQQRLQQENNGGCAMAVKAEILTDYKGSGIAYGLQMELIDVNDVLQAASATDAHVKQAKQAQAEAALKKASANKPSL